MAKKETKICFISTNPNSDGGISNYQKNIIKYIKSINRDINITWVYYGKENSRYIKEGINYVQLKTTHIPFLEDVLFNQKVLSFLNKNYFDVINSHAIWGYWMNKYKKKKNQKLINTYHGVTFPYYKVHLRRFGAIKRILFSPLLLYGYLIEKPPIKYADKIICVSEKVKTQIEDVYKRKEEIFVIRTGVDLTDFKQKNKKQIKKELKLEENKIYGIHVSKAGYWIKGLDRAVKISEEIHKRNKNYRLIVIGPDYKKNKNFLDKEFIIFLESIPREKISWYYNAADISFCLSRYEGGAPTLVTSEAMASGNIVVCSEDSQQEIIEDNKNGIIISKFDKEAALRILKILENERLKEKIIKNSVKTINDISLEKWGEKYIKILEINQ